MTKYEIHLPDGKIESINSKLDLNFAVAILEVDSTNWTYISKHSTFEAALKRKDYLWNKNIKGGKYDRKNWISAIRVVSIIKAGA